MLLLNPWFDPDGHYESAPGVCAGTTQGFTATAACVPLQTDAVLGTQRGIISNFDAGASRGWGINYEVSPDGEVDFSASVGLSDGNTLEVGGVLHSFTGQFFLVDLEVGAGDNASVTLYVNAKPVGPISSTGLGISFAPAANTPLKINRGYGDAASEMSFMGAGFSERVYDRTFLQLKVVQAFTTGRMQPAASSLGALALSPADQAEFLYDFAWDAQSLLASGLRTFSAGAPIPPQRSSAGDIWQPTPNGGDESLTYTNSDVPAILGSVTPGLYQPVPVTAPA